MIRWIPGAERPQPVCALPGVWRLLSASVAAVLGFGCGDDVLDQELRTVIEQLHLTTLDRPASPLPEQVRLGEALFFEKELSGNRDIACATCHHPVEHTGDGLPLPIGTGGRGVGAARIPADGRPLVPRNSPELFNRGAAEWNAMFWDGRVEISAHRLISSPAGPALPDGLEGVLAAQAMFPVTARDEMRGMVGDTAVNGVPNELAAISDDDLPEIWQALMYRLMRIDGYVDLFVAAYPGVAVEDLGFEHAANAIAAYETETFWFAEAPWDAYVGGYDAAISDKAKRGALLFFGKGRCAVCHAGPLFTDQRFHNVGAPQLGPGKGEGAPTDLGRALVTGLEGDRCAFRTPSLRNVTLSGPWMHDGAYTGLKAAVQHMADPARALRDYDGSQVPRELRGMVLSGAVTDDILSTLDPIVATGCDLSPAEVTDLVAFLGTLTDPAATNLSHLVPATVPSGLPVDGARDRPGSGPARRY
jgi:cytochrome c peroxidase